LNITAIVPVSTITTPSLILCVAVADNLGLSHFGWYRPEGQVISTQTAARYATPIRNTLRRLSSPKNDTSLPLAVLCPILIGSGCQLP